MKKKALQVEHFRDLDDREVFHYTGGSFAFDVGRLIRFVILAGPSGQWTPIAMADAIYNHFQ